MTETDHLENETKQMEARLQILQDKLKESQINTDQALSSTSSSRKWKSSSAEKGSIRAYGKEVAEKFKKRIVNDGIIPTVINPNASLTKQASDSESSIPLTSNTSPLPSSSMTAPTYSQSPRENKINLPFESGNFTTRSPDTWSIEDVADWLRSLKLDQYVQAFIDNQINGAILLEFTLEDLDYLQITILAHRKMLLREINDLKQTSSAAAAARRWKENNNE